VSGATESHNLAEELKSFREVWAGGYFEGDPLDPLTRSGYGQLGYMSILHATYLRCIKPFVSPETVALEIGPGRGAWTKTLTGAREVWAMDALSAEHNGFWDYVGKRPNLRYLHVSDFLCADLPDDHFNYCFSFGCFCHVSFDGITQYATNLFPKLKAGAECFWLVADYAQYNRWVDNRERLSIWHRMIPRGRFALAGAFLRLLGRLEWRRAPQVHRNLDEDGTPRPGRWYHAGVERTCAMLERCGYTVLDPDVGTVIRDPIIHFRK
jgi:hypothetical protein